MRFPKIDEVAAELRRINKNDAGEPEHGEEDASIDVRLQVYPDGQWAVRWGDSQYDQDHRGFWGSSSVPGDNRRFDSKDIARDLIDQAREHKATGGDGDDELDEPRAVRSAPKQVRTARAARAERDDKEIPIANPEDCDDDRALYQFQFGPYTGTEVYVWADGDEDAFEIAIEWVDDNAPGLLVTVDEDDLKEAAEDLGIEWDEAWSNGGAAGRKEFGTTWNPYDDPEFVKIVEHAEADLTLIGHTTLKHGTHIPSWEWHFHEVTDEGEIEEVAGRSEEEEYE